MEAQTQQLAPVLNAHPIPRGPERVARRDAVAVRGCRRATMSEGFTVAVPLRAALAHDGEVTIPKSVLRVGMLDLGEPLVRPLQGFLKRGELARRIRCPGRLDVRGQLPERFDG